MSHGSDTGCSHRNAQGDYGIDLIMRIYTPDLEWYKT